LTDLKAISSGSEPLSRNRTVRITGRDVLIGNILAAKIVAEFVRTSLGPHSMNKMLIHERDFTVTADGATILSEVDIRQPAAKLMVEAAKIMDKEVGDGTTTTVVLAAELLSMAENLLRQNVHPITVVAGYKIACNKAIEILSKQGIAVDVNDDETLRKVALTSLEGWATGAVKSHFANLAVQLSKQIAEERCGKRVVDLDHILVVNRKGGSLLDSKLVRGIVEIQTVTHPEMPKYVKGARIALLNYPLIIAHPQFGAEIEINAPFQLKAYLDEEKTLLQKMVNKVRTCGANIVICQQDIDDYAQHYLARERIMALKKVSKKDMEKLARATGGRIVSTMSDLERNDLGHAEIVEERTMIGDKYEEKLVFIEGCGDPRSVTALIRGGIQKVLDEAERALHKALHAVASTVKKSTVLAGGGAIEMELATQLRQFARTISGKEVLAVRAYADALETIPKILIQNAGINVIDTLSSLRHAHEVASEMFAGFDATNRKVSRMDELGIIEPALVKEQTIRLATEVATAILRVDDVISRK